MQKPPGPFLKRIIFGLFNFWPPFLGAGIKVRRISPDMREIDVEMKLRPWNRNYVGTHFGGSLYAMTDPFYMLMLMENLGKDFIVWDKAASIRFLKPGRGKVQARFRINQEQIEAIRTALTTERSVEPLFSCEITNEDGEAVAVVEKTLYVRKNPPLS
jgi:acyl-coenzyme A thioesterase PaaI-like protein